MDGKEMEERRVAEKVAILDERTLQITKTLDTVADRFETSLEKLEVMMVKLSTDTGNQIMAHTLKEEEVWREFRQANDDGHKELSKEIDAKLNPVMERVAKIEKKIWHWGGGFLAVMFVLQNIDTILKMLGK